jgi:rhodanese-related sulfurtransferase
VSGQSAPRRLRNIAIVLGLLAVVAGTPYRPAASGVDLDRLAAVLSQDDYRVSALQLAEWIRDRKVGLRVIDVDLAEPARNDAVPTAEHARIEALTRMRIARADRIVLASEDGLRAAQAWLLLRAAGHERVYVLAGGRRAWQADVLGPTIARDASPEAVRAFERVAAVSRYFGGWPHAGDATTRFDSFAQAGTDVGEQGQGRRRGCF